MCPMAKHHWPARLRELEIASRPLTAELAASWRIRGDVPPG
jgi:hypothetical protein